MIQKNRLFDGDKVDVLRAKGSSFEVALNDMTDENGNKIETANKAQMIFKAKVDTPLCEKDMLIKSKEGK